MARSPYGKLSTSVVAPPGEKPMYLVRSNGRRINMGMVPHEATVSAAQNIGRLERPGRLDIIRPMGRTNREIQFEQIVTSGTGKNAIDSKIAGLRNIVENGWKVKITGGSHMSENGRWYIATGLEVSPIQRSAYNHYSRATLTWTFVEYAEQTVKVITKKTKKVKTSKSRKKSAPKKSTKTKKTTYKTYKVKRGDTLSKIAKRQLGKSTRWRQIWAANKKTVKNPHRLKVGQKLKIPRK